MSNQIIQDNPRDFKGIWIPKEIWFHSELTPQEKILWAEINSLDGADGCFASNAYFCKFFNCRERELQRWLAKLKNLKLIKIISFNGRRRIIKSSLQTTYDKFDTSGVSKMTPLGCQKCHPSLIGDSIERDNKEDNKDYSSYPPDKFSKEEEEFLNKFYDRSNDQMDSVKRQNGFRQMTTPIPDTKTNTETYSSYRDPEIQDTEKPIATYTNEEEEYFEKRMKARGGPPEHMSISYKEKVIKPFRDKSISESKAKVALQSVFEKNKTKVTELSKDKRFSIDKHHMTFTLKDKSAIIIEFSDPEFDLKVKNAIERDSGSGKPRS